MVKAILMLFFFVVMLAINLLSPEIIVRAASFSGAFGAGAFCMYFVAFNEPKFKG